MFARPNMDCHVRFGPETTILTKTTDVQLTPKSGHHLIQSQSISSKGVGAAFVRERFLRLRLPEHKLRRLCGCAAQSRRSMARR